LIYGRTKCYAPDGSEVSETTYVPCIAVDRVHSMCCKMNHTDPDTCGPNELCFSTKDLYWREFCADETWESPNCLPKTTCVDVRRRAFQLDGRDDSLSRRISGSSYCCRRTTDCCGNADELILAPTLVSIGTSNATTIEAVTSEFKNSDSGSSKVTIGVGVGVPRGKLAISVLGFGFYWGKREMWAENEALRKQYEEKTRKMRSSQMAELDPVLSKPIQEVDDGVAIPAELPDDGEANITRS
ncbi:hypothetical protein N7532_006804, partial [Penicillium argentinense]